jgi:hypothetical protein
MEVMERAQRASELSKAALVRMVFQLREMLREGQSVATMYSHQERIDVEFNPQALLQTLDDTYFVDDLKAESQRVAQQLSEDVEGCVMSMDTSSLEGRLARLEKEHEDLKASVATNALSIAALAGLGGSVSALVQQSRERSKP